MKKLNKKLFEPLDEEEKELMESIERDEWKSVKNVKKEITKAMKAAQNTINIQKTINLRLNLRDYNNIKIRAIEEGIPYQMLITNIVHKYLNANPQS